MCSQHLLGEGCGICGFIKDMCGESIVLNVLTYSLENQSGPGDFPFGNVFMVVSIS